jgi:hypothetical protein
VDSTAPDHTTAEAEDMRVEVVAVAALDGGMVLVLELAGHERPSRDVASRATRIWIMLLEEVAVSSTTNETAISFATLAACGDSEPEMEQEPVVGGGIIIGTRT